VVLPSVERYFGKESVADIPKEGVKLWFFSLANDALLQQVVAFRVLIEFFRKMDMKTMNSETLEHYRLNPKELFSVPQPFDTSDIAELSVTVSHLPIVFFAAAKTKRLIAMTSSG
jgi:hypothetical protein